MKTSYWRCPSIWYAVLTLAMLLTSIWFYAWQNQYVCTSNVIDCLTDRSSAITEVYLVHALASLLDMPSIQVLIALTLVWVLAFCVRLTWLFIHTMRQRTRIIEFPEDEYNAIRKAWQTLQRKQVYWLFAGLVLAGVHLQTLALVPGGWPLWVLFGFDFLLVVILITHQLVIRQPWRLGTLAQVNRSRCLAFSLFGGIASILLFIYPVIASHSGVWGKCAQLLQCSEPVYRLLAGDLPVASTQWFSYWLLEIGSYVCMLFILFALIRLAHYEKISQIRLSTRRIQGIALVLLVVTIGVEFIANSSWVRLAMASSVGLLSAIVLYIQFTQWFLAQAIDSIDKRLVDSEHKQYRNWFSRC